MAELVGEPVVSFVVGRVGELIIQEAKFLKGVEGQVQQLQTELELMQCFLKDAQSRREDGDETVSGWVSRIREAAYDAEDVIETFVVKVALRRRSGVFNVLRRYACIFKEFGAVREVGLEIEAINAKITTLTRCLQTYGIQCSRRIGSTASSFERQQQLRRSYTHLDNPDFVGFEADMGELVDQLLKEDSKTIVCLWGMGGLGKTTLAKKVYNHSSIKQQFQYRAWAYISQQCNAKEVWKCVLFKLLSPIPKEEREEIEKLQHQELAGKLSKFLSENKCLVILDDLWEAKAWESLKPAFPETNTESKFLLTTRNNTLFPPGHPHHILHPLEKLTEPESWKLLTKKISRIGGPTGSALCTEMTNAGRDMIQHCEGLPLAIVVLGGVLGTKHTLKEWQTVRENINYYLNKGHGPEKVTEVLALSYEDLPYHLKACFLYLSHFPEDYNILPHKLVQMWIAEDIVSTAKVRELLHNEEQTLMDVGMSYLNELVQRSMVEAQLTRFSRRIKFYKLHDRMRDLCIRKAQEENFSKVIQLNAVDDQLIWTNSAYSSPSSGTTIRRIALHYPGRDDSIRRNGNNIPFNFQERTTHQHVRACLFEFFENDLNDSGRQQLKSLIKGLKLVRVLDIQRLGAPWHYWKQLNWPREIGNLIQLRYFSIRRSGFAALPYSVGNLQFLQTLDLAGSVLRIPNVLWRLKQLRHLYFPKWIRHYRSKGKLRLNGLRKLETLEHFDTVYCNVGCFSELPSLLRVRKFRAQVKDLGMILHFPILKNDSDRLQPGTSFRIEGDCTTGEDRGHLSEFLKRNHIYELTLYVRMETLPTEFSTNLTKLKLKDTVLHEDPMQTLQKLPNLKNLKLVGIFYMGKKMVCSAPSPSTTTASTSNSGGFPQLKSLRISRNSDLEVWIIERGAMPSLIRLQISDCRNLREISEGLEFINTLQELVIARASETLFDKLGDGGTEFQKVARVPFKSITPRETR